MNTLCHSMHIMSEQQYNTVLSTLPELDHTVDHYKIYIDNTVDHLLRRLFMNLYVKTKISTIDSKSLIISLDPYEIDNEKISINLHYQFVDKVCLDSKNVKEYVEEIKIPNNTEDSFLYLELLFGKLCSSFALKNEYNTQYIINFTGTFIGTEETHYTVYHTVFGYLESSTYK